MILYFESILLYFATMLASSCIENQYSKGKEKVVINVHFTMQTSLLLGMLTILDAWALTQAGPWNSSRSNFSFHRQYGKANPFWSINLTLGCSLRFARRWCFKYIPLLLAFFIHENHVFKTFDARPSKSSKNTSSTNTLLSLRWQIHAHYI